MRSSTSRSTRATRWTAKARCASPRENVDAGRQRGRRHPARRICLDRGHRHRLRHDPGSAWSARSSRSSRPSRSARAPASASARSSASRTSRAARSGSKASVGKGTTVSIYLPRTEAAATVRLHPAMQRSRIRGDRPRSPHPAGRGRSAGAGGDRRGARGPRLRAGRRARSGAEAIELFDSADVRPRHHRRHHAGNDRPGADQAPQARRTTTSRCCSSPAMSAKAKATSSSATSCCASHSPSARSPTPSRWRCRADRLANRAGAEEPRQQADRGKQRPAPLPRLDLRYPCRRGG